MNKANELFDLLKDNYERLEVTSTRLNELKTKKEKSDEDIELMQSLWRHEFTLLMDNSSIYGDLINSLRDEDEFTRRRIEKEATKLLKVEIIEL